MESLWLALHLPAPSPSTPELERIACWAGNFSPRVSLAPPRGLLLEVGGCLRLFGGREALVAQAAAGLAAQGVQARLALAATPQAALWLAEGDAASLDALSPAAISLPAGTAERLARFGLFSLGAARRLSAAALGRRLGREVMVLIARAYGEAPDPRPDFVFPARFHQTLELPAPVENAPSLLFAARRLTAALAGWLAARQAGLRQFRLELGYRQGMSELVLGFAGITREGARFDRVLKERLERLPLVAPVETLGLEAAAPEALPGWSDDLFADPIGREGMAALVERLQARLGEARVAGLVPVADHRPEAASRPAAVGQVGVAASGPDSAGRPFWLLARPEPLAEVAGRPYRRGPLTLLLGPERIESGWWDEGDGVGDQRRDYFVALTADDRWAWIFRQLRAPGGWFLHGWFA